MPTRPITTARYKALVAAARKLANATEEKRMLTRLAAAVRTSVKSDKKRFA